VTDFNDLAISGRVATADDADWEEVRHGWNLVADLNPSALALVESADDIAATVRFAAANDLKVAGQGTGHGAAPLAPLDETILIRTVGMRGIEVDPKTQTARVEAGVLSLEVGEAAEKHGLCGMPGSSPDVGVTGFTLGGGLSWLGRKHGFACNRLTAIELVTADGEARTVDADNDPDLFWALRGGGGGYGIVTALHIHLVPVSEFYAGALLFPAEVGAEAVRTYRDWTKTISEDVTSVVRFITPPPLPDVPEPLRGTPLLTIDGAHCGGSREDGEAAFAPLREIGETIMDTFEWMPTTGLSRIHMDPENPVPAVGDGGVLAELSDEAIDAWVGVAGPESGSPLLLSEIRHLGGALARPAENGGALSKLDSPFAIYSVGMQMSPEMGEACHAHLAKIDEAMRPWAGDGAYFNFRESPSDLDRIHPPDVCDRLAEAKAKWDPEGRIVANHQVSAGEAI
jgi:FAD/FMN-containing dehydrogenase